jgi:two-component system sensor histidine kinase AlgZ
MPHAVCPEEIRDLGDWLDRVFAAGPRAEHGARAGEPWLPDLCRLGRLATMLGVAELGVPSSRSRPRPMPMDAARFASASAFALVARAHRVGRAVRLARPLSRLTPWVGGTAAVLFAALIAASGAALVHAVDRGLAYGLVPQTVQLHRFVGGSAAIASLIVAVVLRYLYAVDGWQAQVRASARAETDALQARIKPHFLFNSYEHHRRPRAPRSRRGRTRRAGPVGPVPGALGAGQGESNLAEEVELAERYLSIEQLRLGERLQVRWRRQNPCPGSCPCRACAPAPGRGMPYLHGVSRPTFGWDQYDIVPPADADLLARDLSTIRPRHAGERDAPLEGRGGSGHARSSIAHRPRLRLCSTCPRVTGRLARGPTI